MKNDLINNPTIIKSCDTCEHKDRMSGWCARVGRWSSAEMVNGSTCNINNELTLWVQRLGVFPRLARFFFGG